MRETLVSFDTAILAKRVGYDYPTRYYFRLYPRDPADLLLSDPLPEEMGFEEGRLYNWNSRVQLDDSEMFSRPTQELLEAWLRNKHNVDLVVYRNNHAGNRKKWQYWCRRHGNTRTHGQEPPSTTHEQARELGLVTSIKLILPKFK